MKTQHWIKLAYFVARMAHKGQMRRDGVTPYFYHPLAVSNALPDRLKPIALLHDVVEDTDVTQADLEYLDFPKYILDAVDLLTRKKVDNYTQYLNKIRHNPDALAVKFADIDHNLNDDPTQKQRNKYLSALTILKIKDKL